MKARNVLSKVSFWYGVGNFLLNFAIAIVWLGRWTIRLGKKFLGKVRGQRR